MAQNSHDRVLVASTFDLATSHCQQTIKKHCTVFQCTRIVANYFLINANQNLVMKIPSLDTRGKTKQNNGLSIVVPFMIKESKKHYVLVSKKHHIFKVHNVLVVNMHFHIFCQNQAF